MWAIISCFLFGFIVTSGLAEKGTLLSVIQVHRHGERTPSSYYPTDPYQDISFWGVSEGQLTNRGKRQHLELGRYTRNRYRDFIPVRYSREVYRISSTNMDRTFMSASANAAGLFPPVGDQIWVRNLPWQPIPVFLTEEAILSPLDTCSQLYVEIGNLYTTDYFVNLDKENQDLIEYVSYYSGLNLTSTSGAIQIWDTLHIEALQNFTLPSWTAAVYPEPLTSLANLFFATYSFTEKLKILTAGPFLNAVIEQFQTILTDPSSTQKYVQYSAHDINLASILNALGAFNPPLAPNFASTIYIELRQRRGANYINIYYKNYGDIEPITVAGCDFDCNLDDFISIVSNLIITPDDWYALCNAGTVAPATLSFIPLFT